MTRTDGMNFKQFMAALNKAVQEKIGVSIYDLPDMPFRDWFDGNMSIEDAVSEVMEEADISDFLDDFDDLDDEHDEILAQQELEDFEGLTFRDEEVADWGE